MTNDEAMKGNYGEFLRRTAKMPRIRFDMGALLRTASNWWIRPSSQTVSDFLVLEYRNRNMCEHLYDEVAHSGNWEELNRMASASFLRPLTITIEMKITEESPLPFHTAAEISGNLCKCGLHITVTSSGIYEAMKKHYMEGNCPYAEQGLFDLLVMVRDELDKRGIISDPDD
jgi:hypothetical protein